MMSQIMDDVTAERLKMLENGYAITRNRDKRTFCKEWTTLEMTPELIKSWSRMSRDKATGLRIENGLAAIDFDINDVSAMKEIANAVFDAVPRLGDPSCGAVLFRGGKGAKEAWLVRTDEEFGRLHSRAWTRPGEDVDNGTHRVEIFGGASPRQFGAWRAHTVRDDGVVEVSYSYEDRTPLDTRQSELIELTKAEFFAIVDTVEEVLQRLGWQLVEQSSKGEDHAQRVYDLTEEMSFDLSSGDRVSLQQLRELASVSEGDLRCSASWLEGPQAVRRDRCLVTVTRTGNLAIWESASGVTHCEASLKPRDYTVAINRLREREQEKLDKRKHTMRAGDDALKAAGKLLNSMAFCPHQINCVVPKWATSLDDGITMAQFRTLMQPHCSEEVGPRGGIQRINPVDLWLAHDERDVVRGIRMRPDKERPIYEENGENFINIYRPPDHEATGGSPAGGLLLIEQLFPVALERDWFTRWLAHKLRYPHIPGPGVVHVARDFGTGRGTLAELIKRLLGPSYVRQLPFAAFTGKTYQSQYNEWAASALMVFVNESSESDGSTYQTKRNTYEHLKEVVDPAATEREIYVKSRPNYRALSFTTFFIATQHEDALPIPADDRRFAVLTSGERREESFWLEIREWMASDANVAAFYWHLMEAVDLGDYSPFAPPPKTDAKAAMVEAGMSDLDRAISDAVAAMHTDVFTMEQLVPSVELLARSEGYELPNMPSDRLRATIKKAASKVLFKVGERGGDNERISIENRRYYVWARTAQARKKYTLIGPDELRRDVIRNGGIGKNPIERLHKGK